MASAAFLTETKTSRPSPQPRQKRPFHDETDVPGSSILSGLKVFNRSHVEETSVRSGFDHHHRGPRIKNQNSLCLDPLFWQIRDGFRQDNGCGEWNKEEFSDTDDSEVLLAAESEAKLEFISRRQVEAFDKIKKKKRYLDRRMFDSDSDGEETKCLETSAPLTDDAFIQLFRSHIRRKRARRKIRSRPPEEDKPRIPPNEAKKPKKLSPETKKVRAARGTKRKQEQELGEKIDLPPEFAGISLHHQRHNNRHHRHRNDGDGGGDQGKRHHHATKSSSKRKKGASKGPTVEQLNNRRKKLFAGIVKKEISKAHKARSIGLKDRMLTCKKLAQSCMKVVRQKVLARHRSAKDAQAKARRLTREVQAYWKFYERVERQTKRQQEKEAEEQQKIDLQLLEAKRQQRKLNFMLTQTELFAHFMANKIKSSQPENEESLILSSLEEAPLVGRLAEIDVYDCAGAKEQARKNAVKAIEAQDRQTLGFHLSIDNRAEENVQGASDQGEALLLQEREQPSIFQGTLKKYQLKGMNWLLDLYDQGINGILADEMGLGKTVQALAMLAHIAERYNIWGPFLVVTPASTLHNWQQEIQRFTPAFKVVPYWGSPNERKILRQYWDQTNLHKRTASFHVVVTSYQLVVTDFKFLNRLKWQYMVLDEAQAIKSSSSQRWKMLLDFKCRNRLLLSGTPIQNSMAELWSLLHFVMPTLFDSHAEFNEWFSKDIESSAESKSHIDEKQISRLHMILKPFMLRRIKKDVENELTDKIEVLLYCPLTVRQKLLYMGLKKKIHIEELLKNLGSHSQNPAFTTNLMNLVMQFRKVCNHPDLFERREIRSPLLIPIGDYIVPKLVFQEDIVHSAKQGGSRKHLLYNKFFVFAPENVQRSLTDPGSQESSSTSKMVVVRNRSTFSYLRYIDVSVAEHCNIAYSLLDRLKHLVSEGRRDTNRCHHLAWGATDGSCRLRARKDELILPRLNLPTVMARVQGLDSLQGSAWCELLAWTNTNRMSGFVDVSIYPSKAVDIFEEPRISKCKPSQLPPFLTASLLLPTKVSGVKGHLYCSSPSFVHRRSDHDRCSSQDGWELVCGKSDESERGLAGSKPLHGWSNIVVPDKETLVSDSGKLTVLDGLLTRLKEEGHRVLIYSQMTRMIDLLEEYMWHRKHTYMRLDGSSKIHERRDMVADFQEREDIFVFLLSTRAGGLGINLTAADTVIFYDSDWNPTVDQQAMDRAHRLGQTKQVTVYRLICKGTIEERMLQRAREKSEIQRMVIHGGSFKGARHDLKPKEVVSLLLDDDELERKIRAKSINSSAAATPFAQPSPAAGATPVYSETSKDNNRLGFEDNDDSFLSFISAGLDDSENFEGEFANESSVSFQLQNAANGATTNDRSSSPVPKLLDRDLSSSLPIFDFLGEKIGPAKPKRGTGGRRGRPPSKQKITKLSPMVSSDGSLSCQAMDGNISSNLTKVERGGRGRGPGRPRLRPAGTPRNMGDRTPVTKSRSLANLSTFKRHHHKVLAHLEQKSASSSLIVPSSVISTDPHDNS